MTNQVLIERVVVDLEPDADEEKVEAALAELAERVTRSRPDKEAPEARITRLVDPRSSQSLAKRAECERAQAALKRLERRRVVRFLPDAELEVFVREARELEGVASAALEPRLTAPGDCSVTVIGDDAYANPGSVYLQQHLQAAPQGVDARYAWTCPGGDGCGIGFVAVERRWSTDHKDLDGRLDTLPNAGYPTGALSGETAGDVSADRTHGANTLGVVLARDGHKDAAGDGPFTGVAPNPREPRIGSHLSPSVWAPGLIESEAVELLIGIADNEASPLVVLIELQITLGPINLPIECWGPAYDAIVLASSAGVAVIEPAGNDPGGTDGLDLDAPSSADAALISAAGCAIPSTDSGAIVVMAASGDGASTAGFWHRSDSNRWARAACYGHGDGVPTTASSHTLFADDYRQTSAASSVIAGVALCLLGISRQRGCTLSPAELRALLRNEDSLGNPGAGSLGTPVKASTTDSTVVGSVPDMRAIIDVNFGRPDVYIRDDLADWGAPKPGIAFPRSPDILLHWRYQLYFPVLGRFDFEREVPRFFRRYFDAFWWRRRERTLSVRVRNRGPVTAEDVEVDVYLGTFGTVFDLSSMKHGTLSVADVPSKGVVESPDLDLPAWADHGTPLSVLAVARAKCDPSPELPSDPADYLTFLGRENNAAARSLFAYPIPFPKPARIVWFEIRGFAKASEAELVVDSDLPPGACAHLVVPRRLADAWAEGELYVPRDGDEKDEARVAVPAKGRLGRCIVHAKRPIKAGFVLDAPDKIHRGGQLSIVQRWRGEPVGGVTFVLDEMEKARA